MAQPHFKLHHTYSDGTRDIRLTYLCANRRYFVKPTGERTKHWNKRQERVPPGARDARRINEILDGMEDRIKTIVGQLRMNGEPITVENIRAEWSGQKVDFWTFAEGLLKNPPPDIGKTTIPHYRLMLGWLRDYEEDTKTSLSFRIFNQHFSDSFVIWMRKKKKSDGESYNDNYIRQLLKKLRSMLGYAKKYEAIKRVPDFELPSSGIISNSVALTEDQIIAFYAVRNNPQLEAYGRLDKMRIYVDAFALGTQIGVRVSDLRVRPENVVRGADGIDRLDLGNKKTRIDVLIPISKLAKEILERYQWHLPEIEDAELNRIVKIVGKLAGLNEKMILRSQKAGELVEKTHFMYERIYAHTMRRSFATNMVRLGVPIPMIMRITGHKTVDQFMKYVCLSKEEAAKVIEQFVNLQPKLLVRPPVT